MHGLVIGIDENSISVQQLVPKFGRLFLRNNVASTELLDAIIGRLRSSNSHPTLLSLLDRSIDHLISNMTSPHSTPILARRGYTVVLIR